MGDRNDRGPRRAVRVEHHHRAGVRVKPLTQPGRIPGKRERADRPRGDDATPVNQLASRGAPQPDADDGQPLDEFAPPDGDPGQGAAADDDREGEEQTRATADVERSEEHTSELQSLMRISYAVVCLKKKTKI